MSTDRSARTTPAGSGESITPSDSGSISACRGLWVGTAGTLTIDFRTAGTNISLGTIAANTLLPFDVSRVYSTGTTATDIVAVW